MVSNFYSPTEVDFHTHRLLSILNTGKEPIILSITPEPNSKFGDCFFNVDDKVKIAGGSSCIGWAILRGGTIIEAEAHAVWRNPDGKLVDITPRNSRFKSSSIMFVEDPILVFRGRLIDNRRLNITNNPMVDHVIRIAETVVAIQIPCTKVTKGVQVQPEGIGQIVSVLQKDIGKLIDFINSGGQLHSSCFCNSRLTYINCHGRIEEGMHEVTEIAKTILQKYFDSQN